MIFHNGHTTIPLRTTLEYLGHQQLPTQIETYNSTALGILDSTSKQKKYKATDMRFYWFKDQTLQGKLFVHCGPGKTNKSDYFNKHHPPRHYTAMRHEYLHKANCSLIFIPPQGCINHRPRLSSPNTSHENGGPK